MRRGELARELRKLAGSGMLRGDTFLTETSVPFPDLMRQAAALLEDDTVEKDARRYRVLREMKLAGKVPFCGFLVSRDFPGGLGMHRAISERSMLPGMFPTIEEALDAWIARHGDPDA